ncbi:hypothetical protein K503DRAFT_785776 [Rhizopogon vinicolor AM-OR11-026]|uniref:Uncharacterized protein n=1 Tax=Rhizopogon vinicolor AM-OR11-026 TaxID=1314800 RepID=A0A1B7MPB2_9AGAM|nr:hypothetical protein K503DRAFT_785776 [Rhizopogon vinicolor AM-OR11-026]
MSSDTPETDLWLERSRLAGILLAAVSYGGFLLLTVQSMTAIMPRGGERVVRNRLWLLFYVIITFVSGTIGFAANARYTEMIWIDLRDSPGGPDKLIEDELNYPINIVAVVCYYIMDCFMQALLLHRCLVIWDWSRYVMVPMVILYITMIGAVHHIYKADTGVIWYNMNTVLTYLCIEVCFTVVYTILVTKRLLAMRGQMKETMMEYDSSIYDTVVLMVIESAMLYSLFAIIFIVSFALHSDVANLCFLSISHVQGIAQLLIIVRVARGGSVMRSTPVTAAPTSIVFVGTALDGTNLGRIAKPEEDSVQLFSVKVEGV